MAISLSRMVLSTTPQWNHHAGRVEVVEDAPQEQTSRHTTFSFTPMVRLRRRLDTPTSSLSIPPGRAIFSAAFGKNRRKWPRFRRFSTRFRRKSGLFDPDFGLISARNEGQDQKFQGQSAGCLLAGPLPDDLVTEGSWLSTHFRAIVVPASRISLGSFFPGALPRSLGSFFQTTFLHKKQSCNRFICRSRGDNEFDKG
jgi:hypothetical protein